MTKTLTKRLEQIDKNANAQLSLRDEVSHIVLTYEDVLVQYDEALSLYELAVQSGDEAVKIKARTLRDAAADQLRSVNREVRAAVTDAAKVEAIVGQSFSAAAVREIIAECVRTIYELCGDLHNGDDIAQRFELMIRERVHVSDVVTGTTITPYSVDGEVIAMDEMVPLVEDKR